MARGQICTGWEGCSSALCQKGIGHNSGWCRWTPRAGCGRDFEGRLTHSPWHGSWERVAFRIGCWLQSTGAWNSSPRIAQRTAGSYWCSCVGRQGKIWSRADTRMRAKRSTGVKKEDLGERPKHRQDTELNKGVVREHRLSEAMLPHNGSWAKRTTAGRAYRGMLRLRRSRTGRRPRKTSTLRRSGSSSGPRKETQRRNAGWAPCTNHDICKSCTGVVDSTDPSNSS